MSGMVDPVLRDVIVSLGVGVTPLATADVSSVILRAYRPLLIFVDTADLPRAILKSVAGAVRLDVIVRGAGLIALQSHADRDTHIELVRMGFDLVGTLHDRTLFREEVGGLLRRLDGGVRSTLAPGVLRLDSARSRVRIGATDIRLRRSTFNVLAALARRSPLTLSPENLQDELLRVEGKVLAFGALAVRIFRLRKALGEHAFLVETGQGGYRIRL